MIPIRKTIRRSIFTNTSPSPSPRIGGWIAFVLSLLFLLPSALHASDFEISRLATQINQASGQLAQELHYLQGYSKVKQHANRLSREAGQLVDAVHRNRSPAYLRSQFRDIGRRYANLETAFLRANRGAHSPQLYAEIGQISYLFSSLSTEMYYNSYQELRPYYYAAPFIIGRRHRNPAGYGPNSGRGPGRIRP
jgi:hypothetical protein